MGILKQVFFQSLKYRITILTELIPEYMYGLKYFNRFKQFTKIKSFFFNFYFLSKISSKKINFGAIQLLTYIRPICCTEELLSLVFFLPFKIQLLILSILVNNCMLFCVFDAPNNPLQFFMQSVLVNNFVYFFWRDSLRKKYNFLFR